ncbi:MAG: hypothetical protein NTV54_11705 [Ignavibacteriales bacterium]|nr:hypothetical protein [Ignavibacteriales bacterium]
MGRTKQRTGFFFWPLIAVAMVLLSGCYTILMNPGVKQSDVSSRSTSSYPREINYSDDCTSCNWKIVRTTCQNID